MVEVVKLTSLAEHSTYGNGPDAVVCFSYGDCTGVKYHRPRSLVIARSLFFSYYEMCCFKYLVIVAPNGYVCHTHGASLRTARYALTHLQFGTRDPDTLHLSRGPLLGASQTMCCIKRMALQRGYYLDDNRPMIFVYDKGTFCYETEAGDGGVSTLDRRERVHVCRDWGRGGAPSGDVGSFLLMCVPQVSPKQTNTSPNM